MFVDPTCFNGGLDDANRRSPQDILRYGKVVLGLLERGRCQQACHHADVDSGADERNQTTAVLGRDYHGDDGVGLPVDGARQGDHPCKKQIKPHETHALLPRPLHNSGTAGQECENEEEHWEAVLVPTCVLVECEVRGGPAGRRSVADPAVLTRVEVVSRHSHDWSTRGALRAQADSVADWVKHRPVVINVHQLHLDVGHRAQSALRDETNRPSVRLSNVLKLWTEDREAHLIADCQRNWRWRWKSAINVLKFTREHVVQDIGLSGCARLEIDSSRKERSLMACRERDDAEKTTLASWVVHLITVQAFHQRQAAKVKEARVQPLKIWPPDSGGSYSTSYML